MRASRIDIAKHYYRVKPFIPRRLQILLRRWFAVRKRRSCEDIWPIDPNAGTLPANWQGWPDNKRFALVLTHDVDTFKGHERCRRLMQLERKLGFRSSFNFVAEGYRVSGELRRHLTDNGFEVGVHGLVHNRQLYESHETFRRHAVHINRYMQAWDAVGFRSPCMFHNLVWLDDLRISYDASTFDTDPFEPQCDGVGTIFPFYVKNDDSREGYVELPYTLPQDFTLFVLFRETGIGVWREKLKWLAEKGGMVLLNTHPDYTKDGGKADFRGYPVGYYEEFLEHIAHDYHGQYWHVLPREMADYWRTNVACDLT